MTPKNSSPSLARTMLWKASPAGPTSQTHPVERSVTGTLNPDMGPHISGASAVIVTVVSWVWIGVTFASAPPSGTGATSSTGHHVGNHRYRRSLPSSPREAETLPRRGHSVSRWPCNPRNSPPHRLPWTSSTSWSRAVAAFHEMPKKSSNRARFWSSPWLALLGATGRLKWKMAR